MFGILNLHKPAGVTSRDVVNQVQRLVGSHKAGHAGTLDPLATGVLVVCVGQATRLIEYVQRLPKRYIGTFLLGQRSDTEDVEGRVEELPDPPQPTREQLDAALPQFLGRILQRPPAFSALKVDGKRAYALARRGEVVELEPRLIDIYTLSIERYEYPELTLDIRCGSGTYVRSLGRDLAEAVGTAAVMSALERTEIGPFHLHAGEAGGVAAVAPHALTRANIAAALLPPHLALAALPRAVLSAEGIHELRMGRRIPAQPLATQADEIAVTDDAGRLVALVQPVRNAENVAQWKSLRVFPA